MAKSGLPISKSAYMNSESPEHGRELTHDIMDFLATQNIEIMEKITAMPCHAMDKRVTKLEDRDIWYFVKPFVNKKTVSFMGGLAVLGIMAVPRVSAFITELWGI